MSPHPFQNLSEENHAADKPVLGSRDSEIYYFSVAGKEESAEILCNSFAQPYSIFIENSKRDDKASITELLTTNPPEIAVFITTASCYYGNLAHHFTDSLRSKLFLNDDQYMQIVTCLQEAAMNAILHGNLEMESDFFNIADLYLHQAKIEEKLSSEEYALRRVNVLLWKENAYITVAVSDEGKGFSLPGGNDLNKNDTLPHGRGLMLIKAMSDNVWIGKDNRTLFMMFDY